MTGWTCPKCGCSYAPFVSECHRCNNASQWTAPTTNIPFVTGLQICTCGRNSTAACPMHQMQWSFTTCESAKGA